MRKRSLSLFSILLIAVLVRLGFLFTPFFTSDEAIIGLMGRHILRGELPIFFYGQPYEGAMEAYIAAGIFSVLGASRLTLALAPMLVYVFFALAVYRLVREAWDKNAARMTVLFAAASPVYFTMHCVTARGSYIETCLFGTLVFLLTWKIITGRGSRTVLLSLLGLVAGVSFWTQFHILPFLFTSAFFILLYDRRLVLSRGFWLAVPLFFIGSSPFWVYNIEHSFASLQAAGGFGMPSVKVTLHHLFIVALPIILGVHKPHTVDAVVPVASYAVLAVCAAAFIWAAAGGLGWARSSLRHAAAARFSEKKCFLFMLLVFAAIFLFMYHASGRSQDYTTRRYFIPLYCAIFPVLGIFISELAGHRKLLGYSAAGILLASNLYGNVTSYPVFDKQELARYRNVISETRELFRTLENANITRVYMPDYWEAPRLTFDAEEKIIFAQPFRDRYPPFADAVDASTEPAFLFREMGFQFVNLLPYLCRSFSMTRSGGYTIFSSFAPFERPAGEIAPSEMTASASAEGSDARLALDRDIGTRWTTLRPQKEGECFELTLKEPRFVSGVSVYYASSHADVPRGLAVETSDDAGAYDVAAGLPFIRLPLFWSGTHPFMKPEAGRMEVFFNPRRTRNVKLVQTGVDPKYYWSMHEVFLHTPEATHSDGTRGGPSPRDAGPGLVPSFRQSPRKVAAAAMERGCSTVFCDWWLASAINQEGKVKAYARRTLALREGSLRVGEESEVPVQLCFAVEQGDSAGLEQQLESARITWQKEAVPPFLLYFPQSSGRKHEPRAKAGIAAVTSSHNQRDAAKAIDKDPGTRWASDTHREAGMFLQVELEAPAALCAVSLDAAAWKDDLPLDFSLETSLDGKTWEKAKDLEFTKQRFLWYGKYLFRDGDGRCFIEFPPVSAKFLRITLTSGHHFFFWSIGELTLFAK